MFTCEMIIFVFSIFTHILSKLGRCRDQKLSVASCRPPAIRNKKMGRKWRSSGYEEEEEEGPCEMVGERTEGVLRESPWKVEATRFHSKSKMRTASRRLRVSSFVHDGFSR